MKQPIRSLLMRWPATTCALAILIMEVLLAPLALQYDDNGLGSLLFLLHGVLGFFFEATGGALYSLNGNQWLRYHTMYTVLIGFPIYVLCDLLLHLLLGAVKKLVEQESEG